MRKALWFGAVLFFVIISSVTASFPDVHTLDTEEICQQSTNSPIKDIICNNLDAAIACNHLDDISVVYYFTNFERYDATHSPAFCKRMQEIATNERELACAYGACLHQIQDAVRSHNNLVPWAIEMTGLQNSLIHPLIEQKENDYYVSQDKNLESRTRTYLSSATEFSEMFKKALQDESSYSNVNIDQLIDFYVTQVQGNSGYDLGFKAVLAVPVSVYVVIILVLFAFLFAIVALAKVKKKNLANKITIGILVVPVVLILILLGSVFIGGTYNVFKAVSKPINMFVPSPSWDNLEKVTHVAQDQFLALGNSYINQISNPTGMCESNVKCTGKIPAAEAVTAPLRILVMVILILLVTLLVWLNIRKTGFVY